MKRILIFATLTIFGFIFLSFIWEKSGNSLKRKGLKGRVKSISEHCYIAKQKAGKTAKGKLDYEVLWKYDSLGNELLKSEYDYTGFYAGDTINLTHCYKYNAHGKITEMYDDPSFNEDGGIKEDNGFATKSVNKYNEKGELIEVYDYGSEITRLDFKTIYKYNGKGNMIEEDDYEKGKIFVEKILYDYDDKRNIINITSCHPVDSVSGISAFKYDSAGNEIADSIVYGNGGFGRFTKKFDNEGNQIEMKMYTERSKSPRISRYTYEYDKTGNWVKEVNFEKGKPKYITERKIEYY